MKRLIFHSNNLLHCIGAAALSILVFLPQAEAATSPWQESLGGRMRLISGGTVDGHYKAGLEIVLDAGWKTYWKVPGDSGIPPLIDASGSGNMAKMEIRWPAPVRYKVGTSEMLGFKDAIIFPILVTPDDDGEPVELKINAQLGLCSELCVPIAADLSLDISGGDNFDPGAELLIDRDMALVPGVPSEGFSIADIAQETPDNAPGRLLISTRIPDGYGDKDLFVEGPEGWLLPLAKPLALNGDTQQFELLLEGLPKGAVTKGAQLTFTLTNGDDAVEQSITLKN
ncbi:Thiol-disulfide interchange protein, contains DsbC and DsbD domains [Cohaesibacter sp. ES.047]|uniref:protein-disulfide reductase DsbD domain-containing protein n=1 Tax=Cohaesibacter sp. ES.047 TaxID=1798205 RepID=UPI000BC03775|nr:protein-disulfide reductase DsbD domain-containing protein [Cohaesibacter sp. ES.047]SNY92057.1 Thiol-disulfide interchange protein, contains DsbC and DsbD domains [Cohaesibacter sp. ES.047]